jgi:hypothetical protein
LTLKQLGRAYLRAVKPLNAQSCRIGKKIDGITGTNWQDILAPLRHYAEASRDFADWLRRIEWNRDARREADRLIEAQGRLEAALRVGSTSESLVLLNSELNRIDLLASRAQEFANVLRGALGLPSVKPGGCD